MEPARPVTSPPISPLISAPVSPPPSPPEEASARTAGAEGSRSLGARSVWLSVGQARDSCSWAFDAPTPVSPWVAPRWILAEAFAPAFAVSGLRSWA